MNQHGKTSAGTVIKTTSEGSSNASDCSRSKAEPDYNGIADGFRASAADYGRDFGEAERISPAR